MASWASWAVLTLRGYWRGASGSGALPYVSRVWPRAARPAGAGGADGLVGLLGVLGLAGVLAGGVRQVVLAVLLQDLAAGGGHRGLRQRGAVGSHVGDVAVLVQALGDGHRAGRPEAQLAARLL